MRFVRKSKNKSRVCRILSISRSAIYYQHKRPKEDILEKEVLSIFDLHNSNYGSIRIKKILNEKGQQVSKRRIIKLLKKNGRESKHGRKKLAKNIYTAKEARFIAENLIKGEIATQSNEICQLDTTQLKASNGTVYITGAIDVYDKTVTIAIGNSETKELVVEAIKERVKNGIPKKLHSDRGSANASKRVKELLEELKITQSMSAPASPNENQYIETFWKTLKTEIGNTKNWTVEEVKQVVTYYVNYYNNERIHSSINYMTPKAKQLLGLAQEAA